MWFDFIEYPHGDSLKPTSEGLGEKDSVDGVFEVNVRAGHIQTIWVRGNSGKKSSSHKNECNK